MKRPKYKELYELEKIKRTSAEERFNFLIEQLKSFDLKVKDKVYKDKYGNFDTRIISIKQDKEHFAEFFINQLF